MLGCVSLTRLSQPLKVIKAERHPSSIFYLVWTVSQAVSGCPLVVLIFKAIPVGRWPIDYTTCPDKILLRHTPQGLRFLSQEGGHSFLHGVPILISKHSECKAVSTPPQAAVGDLEPEEVRLPLGCSIKSGAGKFPRSSLTPPLHSGSCLDNHTFLPPK